MVNKRYYVKKHGEYDGDDVSVSWGIHWFILHNYKKVLFILLPCLLPMSRGCVHLGGTGLRKIREIPALCIDTGQYSRVGNDSVREALRRYWTEY
jgi:hypothetical protein